MGVLKGAEETRIKFYIKRDGLDEARKKVREIQHIYRHYVLKKIGICGLRSKRIAFVESYLHFKRFSSGERV